MARSNVWSKQYNESRGKLNFTDISWENLMNECLIKTEISQRNEIEKQESLLLDSNIVMNLRHKMFKQSSKVLPSSQAQIQTEARKLLRLESQVRLMKQKEEKIIEKEIMQLKQILENHRLSSKKEICEMFNKKIKSSSCLPKFSKHYSQWQKQLDSYKRLNEVYYIHMMMTTKSAQQKIFTDINKGQSKESLEFPTSRKGSLVEQSIENANLFLAKEEEKNEAIMRSFTDNDFLRNELNQEIDFRDDTDDMLENKREQEIQNKIKSKKLEYAKTWKSYTQRLRCRKGEQISHRSKIETFLSNLQERETKQKKTKETKNIIKVKYEMKPNFMLKKTCKTPKKMDNEEKQDRLKKLMQEVKTSQANTKKKLEKIAKTNLKKQEKSSSLTFLKNLEKRRQERLARRKEIQEKKLIRKEEKEKAQKEEEEKKRQKEEEQNRKRLVELKEMRNLKKWKKLMEKEKMENLRRNARLAKNYYEMYLLRNYGWKPWAMLLKIRHLQYQHAVTFHEKNLMRRVFQWWTIRVMELMRLKTENATTFYEKSLKKNCILIWKKFLERKKEMDRIAEDWCEFKTTARAFKSWLKYTQQEQLNYLNKTETAEQFYYRKLKIIYMKKLRNYPKLKKLEQVREIRKQTWRRKIKEILPDYQPVDDF